MYPTGLTSIALACVWTGVYMSGFSWSGDSRTFNWHPLLMTMGLVYLYGNAAVVYRVVRTKNKLTLKWLHAVLNGLSLVFAFFGVVAVVRNHHHNNIPNGYTLHSWIGITTLVLYAFQLLFGFSAFLYPKFGENVRAIYLKVHVFFGGAIFSLAIVACVSGITEKLIFKLGKEYSSLPGCAMIGNMLGASIVLFGMTAVHILYNKDWRKKCTE